MGSGPLSVTAENLVRILSHANLVHLDICRAVQVLWEKVTLIPDIQVKGVQGVHQRVSAKHNKQS